MRKPKAFRTEADGRVVEVRDRYRWRHECLNRAREPSVDLVFLRLRSAHEKGKITASEFSALEAIIQEWTHSIFQDDPNRFSEHQGILLRKAGILQYAAFEDWKTISGWWLVVFAIFSIITPILAVLFEGYAPSWSMWPTLARGSLLLGALMAEILVLMLDLVQADFRQEVGKPPASITS